MANFLDLAQAQSSLVEVSRNGCFRDWQLLERFRAGAEDDVD